MSIPIATTRKLFNHTTQLSRTSSNPNPGAAPGINAEKAVLLTEVSNWIGSHGSSATVDELQEQIAKLGSSSNALGASLQVVSSKKLETAPGAQTDVVHSDL